MLIPKMRERKLRNVNWRRALKQKGIKQTGVKWGPSCVSIKSVCECAYGREILSRLCKFQTEGFIWDVKVLSSANVEIICSVFFTFMGPCIFNIFKHKQQDATLHNSIYYYNAPHVSGGSSALHQELKTVYTASGICRDFSASYRYREWIPNHSR